MDRIDSKTSTTTSFTCSLPRSLRLKHLELVFPTLEQPKVIEQRENAHKKAIEASQHVGTTDPAKEPLLKIDQTKKKRKRLTKVFLF